MPITGAIVTNVFSKIPFDVRDPLNRQKSHSATEKKLLKSIINIYQESISEPFNRQADGENSYLRVDAQQNPVFSGEECNHRLVPISPMTSSLSDRFKASIINNITAYQLERNKKINDSALGNDPLNLTLHEIKDLISAINIKSENLFRKYEALVRFLTDLVSLFRKEDFIPYLATESRCFIFLLKLKVSLNELIDIQKDELDNEGIAEKLKKLADNSEAIKEKLLQYIVTINSFEANFNFDPVTLFSKQDHTTREKLKEALLALSYWSILIPCELLRH